VPVTDDGDGVGVEAAHLAGAHPGAGEQFDDEAVARIGGGVGGGHQPGGVVVVEEAGQRFGAGRQIAAEDRVAQRSVGPVPLDDPFEEGTQRPQSLPLGGRREAAVHAGLGGEPHLVVLDVVAGDGGDGGDLGVVDQPAGQLPQR
jgi:hypothetical protein